MNSTSPGVERRQQRPRGRRRAGWPVRSTCAAAARSRGRRSSRASSCRAREGRRAGCGRACAPASRAAVSSSCSWPRTFAWPTNSASDCAAGGRPRRRARPRTRARARSGRRRSSRPSALRAGPSRARVEAQQRLDAVALASRRCRRPRRRPPRTRCAPASRGRRGPTSDAVGDRRRRAAVLRDGRGARARGELAGQRDDDELGGLRADAGHLAERRVVVGGDGLRRSRPASSTDEHADAPTSGRRPRRR